MFFCHVLWNGSNSIFFFIVHGFFCSVDLIQEVMNLNGWRLDNVSSFNRWERELKDKVKQKIWKKRLEIGFVVKCMPNETDSRQSFDIDLKWSNFAEYRKYHYDSLIMHHHHHLVWTLAFLSFSVYIILRGRTNKHTNLENHDRRCEIIRHNAILIIKTVQPTYHTDWQSYECKTRISLSAIKWRYQIVSPLDSYFI